VLRKPALRIAKTFSLIKVNAASITTLCYSCYTECHQGDTECHGGKIMVENDDWTCYSKKLDLAKVIQQGDICYFCAN
jgi:hypothetical protein